MVWSGFKFGFLFGVWGVWFKIYIYRARASKDSYFVNVVRVKIVPLSFLFFKEKRSGSGGYDTNYLNFSLFLFLSLSFLSFDISLVHITSHTPLHLQIAILGN